MTQLQPGLFTSRFVVTAPGEHRVRVIDPVTQKPVAWSFTAYSTSVEPRKPDPQFSLAGRASLREVVGRSARFEGRKRSLLEQDSARTVSETSVEVRVSLDNTWACFPGDHRAAFGRVAPTGTEDRTAMSPTGVGMKTAPSMRRLRPLRRRLARLRGRRRRFRLATAATALAIALLWALAGVFALDWWFQRNIDVWQRLLLVGLATGGVAWAFARFSRPWLGKREDDMDMALLVQRQAGIDSDLVAALQFQSADAAGWGSGGSCSLP